MPGQTRMLLVEAFGLSKSTPYGKVERINVEKNNMEAKIKNNCEKEKSLHGESCGKEKI